MKKISIFTMLLALSGCTATNYADFEISNAAVSNVNVNETVDLAERVHVVNISFDYTIEHYNPDPSLYTCSVLFTTTDGRWVTSHTGKKEPCKITNAAGNIQVNWPTPLDKSLKKSTDVLSKIKYPIEYFVAIHQKTGSNSSRVIGQSETIFSKIN